MKNQGNQSQAKRIYVKTLKEWIEVSDQLYQDYTRRCDATRHREQYHGRCTCPRKLYWLCDEDCPACEFHRAGDVLSLDHEVEGGDGQGIPLVDTLADHSPSVEDVVADMDAYGRVSLRVIELMPEAVTVAILRERGLTESAIAQELGIPRTTLRSRLAKLRARLSEEFPGIAI